LGVGGLFPSGFSIEVLCIFIRLPNANLLSQWFYFTALRARIETESPQSPGAQAKGLEDLQ
jgi:hypothetical protein